MSGRAAGLLAALLVALLSALPAAAQGPRVALVVGVGAYQAVPALGNPPNDAADIAASLTRLGFDVNLVRDPDRAALEGAVRRFGQRARGADAALFFYAGHALQLGERNWLLPVSASIASDRDLRFEALELDSVLEQINGAARLSIILMDACRDNPFRLRLGPAASRGIVTSGLAQVPAAVGTLIAFSTAPGLVAEDGSGRNSPFTAALLRHIETPGLELRAMMAEVRREVREATQGRQVPWEHSAMEGSFLFRAAAAPQAQARPAPGPAPATPAPATREADLLFWDSVRNSRNQAELRAYLERFPNGVFADLARSRLTALEQRAETARQGAAQAPNARAPAGPAAAAPQPTPAPPAPQALAAAGAPPAPQAPAAASPQVAAAAPSAPALTVEQIRQAIPYLSPEAAAQVVQRYGSAHAHRALVANADRRGWWFTSALGLSSAAEQVALERCQIANGSPCVLIAVDDELRGRVGTTAPQPMPRVAYAGPLVVEQVPGLSPLARQSHALLRDYAAASGPKALAMHPWGRFFPVTGAANEREAQARALEACNGDTERAGRDGPCFVYAVGDQVVLPERRREAAGPPPPRPAPQRPQRPQAQRR